MTQVVLFNIFNGLIVGAFYALMALGLSLILNLSGVINFAHGGFLALGAYLAYTLIPYVGFWGALIVAPLLTAALGLVIERVLIRPLYGGDPLYGLLLTFGLAYIFEDMTRFIWGAQSLPFQVPGWLTTSLSSEFFFVTGYRVFMIAIVVVAVGGLFAVLNHTRLGMRIRAGTRDLDTVSNSWRQYPGASQPQLRHRHLHRWPGRRAGGGPARPFPDDRRVAPHAELRRDYRRGTRQPARHVARRSPDRRRFGAGGGLLSIRHRGGHLCDDGTCAAGPPPRPTRRRGEAPLRSGERTLNGLRRHALDLTVGALLLSMPFWLAAIGGYTELASRIVVMGLAAMSLNFLLGFTGVLSFGHAAYFGLGAYGVAMAIKYLGAGTIPAMALGMLVATLAAMVIGALIVKRRGVYFAMVTIAFGQVFYFLAFRWNSLTGGDDGLTGWHRMPIDFGFARLDIFGSDKAFYYFALAAFAVCVGAMAMLLASPFGRTLIAIRENERRARFLGLPIEFHIWLSFVISCLFVSVAGGLYALLNNFTDPRALRFDLSGNLVIMAVLGGMRSFWGPLIGAAIFVALQDYVSSRTENWMSVIGLVFVLVVRFFPRGVVGMLRNSAKA